MFREGGRGTTTCWEPKFGRKVEVALPLNDPYPDDLIICEVEVFGKGGMWTGKNANSYIELELPQNTIVSMIDMRGGSAGITNVFVDQTESFLI